MKKTKLYFAGLIMLISCAVNAQSLSPKAQERENNQVDIFTIEEISELQIWFYERTKLLNLEEQRLEDYEAHLMLYMYRMQRLDDKDKGFTYEEALKELQKLIGKLNSSVQEVLNKDEFMVHEETINKLFDRVKKRMQEKKYIYEKH